MNIRNKVRHGWLLGIDIFIRCDYCRVFYMLPIWLCVLYPRIIVLLQLKKTPRDIAEDGYNYSEVILVLNSASAWRRRLVSVWLSSKLSGGDNILYHLPSDIAQICGSYI